MPGTDTRQGDGVIAGVHVLWDYRIRDVVSGLRGPAEDLSVFIIPVLETLVVEIEALPHFKASLPKAEIIILTQSNKEADVLRTIQSGAAGYLLTSSSMLEIVQTIRTVVSGGASLNANVAKFILQTMRTQTTNLRPGPRRFSPNAKWKSSANL
ncbi:hypothetical protein ACFL6U_28150 [Planctomycetota bacterium]